MSPFPCDLYDRILVSVFWSLGRNGDGYGESDRVRVIIKSPFVRGPSIVLQHVLSYGH